MPFLTRAQTIYERGNTVAAAIALVEGLKRDPNHAEAFRWLLDLYCEEMESTGLEEDLVSVIEGCPDPESTYRYIFQRLVKANRERYVRRLDRARRELAQRQGRYAPPWGEVLRQWEDERRERRGASSVDVVVDGLADDEDDFGSLPGLDPEDFLIESGSSGEGAPGEEGGWGPEVAAVVVGAGGPGGVGAVLSAGGHAMERQGQGSPGYESHGVQAPHRVYQAAQPSLEGEEAQGAWGEASEVGAGLRGEVKAFFGVSGEAFEMEASARPAPFEAPSGPEDDGMRRGVSQAARRSWHDVVHPALIARQARRAGGDEVGEGIVVGAGGGWAGDSGRRLASESMGSVPDLDSVRAWEDRPPHRQRPNLSDVEVRSGSSPLKRRARNFSGSVLSGVMGSPQRGRSGGRSGGRKSHARVRKQVTRAVGLVLLCGVAVLALGRLWTVADRRHAVSATRATVERFEPPLLQQAELALSAAFEEDPSSLELGGRLTWTRSLRRYVDAGGASLGALSLPEEVASEVSETAWGRGAGVLDALMAGDVEEASSRVAGLREAAEDSGSFPQSVAKWLEGEVLVAQGSAGEGRLRYQEAADAGLLPAMVATVDMHMRRGDVVSGRKTLAALSEAAPDHPAVAVGGVALDHIEGLVADPRGASLEPPESLQKASLSAAALDRRLAPWVVLASPAFASQMGLRPEGSGYPVLKLVYAREALMAGRGDDAALQVDALAGVGLDEDLKEAGSDLLTGGFGAIGRPDLALEHVASPGQAGEVGAEMFAKDNPSAALERAGLLAQLGRFGESRQLLARLLTKSKYEPEARIIALQMHLAEGRVEDVKRHIKRLKSHRGALVGDAALDLYRDRPASAGSSLGPVTVGSLPDAEESPHLRRLEIRVRLLSLWAQGHKAQLEGLMRGVEVPAALKARLLGPERGARIVSMLRESPPTALDDMLDLSSALLALGEPEAAREFAARVLKMVPTHSQAHQLVGECLLKLRRGKAAMRHLEAGSRGREDQPQVGLALAEAMMESGARVKALWVLQDHLKVNPHDLKALSMLGEAYRGTRRFTVGRNDFGQRFREVSQAKEPKAAGEIAFQLAWLHQAQHGKEEGGRWLVKARRLLGDRPDVLLLQADHFRVTKRPEAALPLYQRVAGLPGSPARVHVSLGRCAIKAGRGELAKESLQRYLEVEPDGESASWAKRQLARL